VEALGLYWRDWKKIEAYVQTKSVIQIRSHAQKYFIKMQKEGRPNAIPPKRRKRDPANPNQPTNTREPKADKKSKAAAIDAADHAHAQTLAELFGGLGGEGEGGEEEQEEDEEVLDEEATDDDEAPADVKKRGSRSIDSLASTSASASSSPSSSPSSKERSIKAANAEAPVDTELSRVVKRARSDESEAGTAEALKRQKVVHATYRIGQPLHTSWGPAVVHGLRDDGDYDVVLAGGSATPTRCPPGDMWVEEKENVTTVKEEGKELVKKEVVVDKDEAAAMENATMLQSLSPFIFFTVHRNGEAEGEEKT
jgi:hypothetical protein